MQTLRGLIALLLVSIASFAQKAYDVETFKGSTKDFDVTFNFAVGLGEASEATLVDKSKKRTITFQRDFAAPGKMELIPVSKDKGTRIIVAVDPNDISDHKRLKCTVHLGDTKHSVTLVRSTD
jgi:hypothetical protein